MQQSGIDNLYMTSLRLDALSDTHVDTTSSPQSVMIDTRQLTADFWDLLQPVDNHFHCIMPCVE